MSTLPMDAGLPADRDKIARRDRDIDGTDWAHLPLDRTRGSFGMMLTIATEAFLFIALFFAYGFLGNNKQRWHWDAPPRLHYAIPMLIILICSSFVMIWGERQVKHERYAAGRIALVVTIVMGLVFLLLSSFDYREHWRDLTPQSDSYGSIFYTIVSFHAAHVIVGLLILIYLLFLPRYAPADESPHRPYHIGTMYWHFVDIVWIFVVAILYVVPNVWRL